MAKLKNIIALCLLVVLAFGGAASARIVEKDFSSKIDKLHMVITEDTGLFKMVRLLVFEDKDGRMHGPVLHFVKTLPQEYRPPERRDLYVELDIDGTKTKILPGIGSKPEDKDETVYRYMKNRYMEGKDMTKKKMNNRPNFYLGPEIAKQLKNAGSVSVYMNFYGEPLLWNVPADVLSEWKAILKSTGF